MMLANGKEMQFAPAATVETVFVSDGVNPVKVIFKDAKTNKGIWLNAFELSQWSLEL